MYDSGGLCGHMSDGLGCLIHLKNDSVFATCKGNVMGMMQVLPAVSAISTTLAASASNVMSSSAGHALIGWVLACLVWDQS